MRPRNAILSSLRHLLLPLLFVSALCATSHAQPPAKPAQTIRIVSWNLAWFPGKKPEPTAEE